MHRTLYIKLLKPKTHFMYRQFNIQKSYVVPTQCIYVFCMDNRTNSDYLTIQHHLIGLIAEAERVYCAVRTVSLSQTDTTLCK